MTRKPLNQVGLSYFRLAQVEVGLHTLHIFTHRYHMNTTPKLSVSSKWSKEPSRRSVRTRQK